MAGLLKGNPVSFKSAEARGAWNQGADAWEEFVETGADYYRTEVHGPGLLSVCGDVNDLTVLDLGCGQGWFSRQLARRGAQVTGLDLSPKMLAHARRHEKEEPLAIEFVEMDAAAAGEYWPEGSFDLVTACMSLQDMTEPETALTAAHQLLGLHGRLAFSVPHPFTELAHRQWVRDEKGNKLALEVDEYFESGEGTLHWDMDRLRYPWETPRWRFTLSEWCSLATKAGFVVTKLTEPRPAEDQVLERPELEDCRRLPYFLVFECQMGSRSSSRLPNGS